jgi:hypothetical protein
MKRPRRNFLHLAAGAAALPAASPPRRFSDAQLKHCNRKQIDIRTFAYQSEFMRTH